MLILFGCLLALAFAVWCFGRRRSVPGKLPPGPKGLPLLGNALQLSKTPWKEFEVWKKEHGPLMYLTAAGQGILVLNTHEAATELFDRRTAIYCRPKLIVAGEILTGGLHLTFTPDEAIRKKMRRAINEALAKSKVTQYHLVQTKMAISFVDRLLNKSGDWRNELPRVKASVILSILYDLPEITSRDDPVLNAIKEYIETFLYAASPGNYFVEFFPWMKNIPSSMAKWKRDAEANFVKFSQLWGKLFCDVKTRIDEGDERPSFAATLIRERGRFQLTDPENEWLCGALYAGGVETAESVLKWFILAMVAYPDKQKKCQDELDAVVGRSRMPTFKDRDSLPYLQATVREALRWRPVGPIVAPRVAQEDDYYQGYLIPKGTICFANVWCLNRDTSIYGDDADDFNPDRFIDEKGQLTPALPDTKDGHLTYGFGQLICPGRHLGTNGLFITIACLLWAVNIRPAKDENGKEIIPDLWGQVGGRLSTPPLPFECTITPRFPEANTIVARTKETI